MIASVRALEYFLLIYSKVWHGSMFSTTLLPVLYMLSIGLGVGGMMDDSAALGGLEYATFIAPGILCATAIQLVGFEFTYPVFGGYREWGGHYKAMRSTSLRLMDILNGHLLYTLAFRVPLAVGIFAIVLLFFGAYDSWLAPLAVPAAIVAAAACGTLLFAYTSFIDNEVGLAVIQRFAIIPLTLFSGVFFPIDQMPDYLRPLAYASPLWHGVELARSATAGVDTAWPVPAHLGYLVALFALGWWLSLRMMTKRLAV